MCDISSLPTEHSKILLYELLQDNNVKDVECLVTAGSEKGDNYVGDIKRIKVTSKRDGTVLFNFVLKYTPNKDMFSNMSLSVDEVYDREATMYRIILPKFVKFQEEFHVPKDEMFLYAKCYKADNQILLMEDLNVSGFKMHDRFAPYDSYHMELVLRNLGRYHALSFALKEHDQDKYWDLVNFVRVNIAETGLITFITKLSSQAIKAVDENMKEKFNAFFADAGAKYKRFTNPVTTEPYNVICHGNTWDNNILFKYKNDVPVDMRFLDWQLPKYCSPITDITNSLYCSTDSKIRNEYGGRFFDIYYNSLDRHLRHFKLSAEKCYPRRVFDEHLKILLPYGLLLCAPAISVFLAEKGKEYNVEDWSGPDVKKPLAFGKANVERLNDLVNDFIEMKYI